MTTTDEDFLKEFQEKIKNFVLEWVELHPDKTGYLYFEDDNSLTISDEQPDDKEVLYVVRNSSAD